MKDACTSQRDIANVPQGTRSQSRRQPNARACLHARPRCASCRGWILRAGERARPRSLLNNGVSLLAAPLCSQEETEASELFLTSSLMRFKARTAGRGLSSRLPLSGTFWERPPPPLLRASSLSVGPGGLPEVVGQVAIAISPRQSTLDYCGHRVLGSLATRRPHEKRLSCCDNAAVSSEDCPLMCNYMPNEPTSQVSSGESPRTEPPLAPAPDRSRGRQVGMCPACTRPWVRVPAPKKTQNLRAGE